MTAAAVVSGDCPHEHWTAQAQIIRDTDVEGGPVVATWIELTAACVECQAPILWSGVQAGSEQTWEEGKGRAWGNAPLQPMVSSDRTVIAIPCEPHPPGVRS